MRVTTLFVMMICVFTLAHLGSGDEMPKKNPEFFLPTETAGWKWDGKEMKYDPKTVFSYMDGSAELYLAYGFQSLVVHRYEKPDRPPITVELYEMGSSEDAFGVFSFERQDEDAGIGQGSE